MKLIFCRKCSDVVKLDFELRKCKCGKSSGKYIDNLNAEIYGMCIPIGFSNYSLYESLQNQPENAPGRVFEAFVIEKNCKTIKAKVNND